MMKKKILAVTILAMGLVITGCGGEDAGTVDVSESVEVANDDAQVSDDTEEATEETTEAAEETLGEGETTLSRIAELYKKKEAKEINFFELELADFEEMLGSTGIAEQGEVGTHYKWRAPAEGDSFDADTISFTLTIIDDESAPSGKRVSGASIGGAMPEAVLEWYENK